MGLNPIKSISSAWDTVKDYGSKAIDTAKSAGTVIRQNYDNVVDKVKNSAPVNVISQGVGNVLQSGINLYDKIDDVTDSMPIVKDVKDVVVGVANNVGEATGLKDKFALLDDMGRTVSKDPVKAVINSVSSDAVQAFGEGLLTGGLAGGVVAGATTATMKTYGEKKQEEAEEAMRKAQAEYDKQLEAYNKQVKERYGNKDVAFSSTALSSALNVNNPIKTVDSKGIQMSTNYFSASGALADARNLGIGVGDGAFGGLISATVQNAGKTGTWRDYYNLVTDNLIKTVA
ncbi:MAG: hypothetical protein K6E51_02665 [Treponema sp.]|nr:hypothetical protein [Treponema sp.]